MQSLYFCVFLIFPFAIVLGGGKDSSQKPIHLDPRVTEKSAERRRTRAKEDICNLLANYLYLVISAFVRSRIFFARHQALSVAFSLSILGYVLLPLTAAAQTTAPTPEPSTTTATLNSNQTAQSQTTENPGQGASNNSSELNPVIVTGQLDTARDQIVPYLGATKYTIPQAQIQNESQGSNAPFNHVILQAPGVVQDSYGQLHVRDEHANLQYRIDDVLIPEGITGFGQYALG